MKHLQWIRIGLASAVLLLGGIVASTSATAAPCVRECLGAGEYAEKLVVGGVTRDYIVHVPASYSGSTAVPLVLDLHGYTSDNVQQRLISGQLQQSDDRGFIVAWPQGLDRSWNAYGCCGKSLERGVDDAGFMRALVANIRRRANVDGARVYITGLSNGGSMSHRMACEAADIFRAAAPVSFTLNRQPEACRPSRAIPVVAFNGTSDPLVNYWGIGPFQSAAASRDAWGKIDGCIGTPVATPLRLGSRSEMFQSCRGGVKTGLVTILGGEHILYPNLGVNIAEFIWMNVFTK